jgi:aerobic carbon-monoxide dehydrogenase large subunit
MLHMAVLRSPHAHATIGRVDAAAALRAPGVAAVVTAADLDDVGPFPVLAEPPNQRQSTYPVLPADKVRYVGQPVAAVAAATRYAAEDALDAVAVSYEPLPAVVDVDRALADGAPRLYDWPDNRVVWREINTGDVDAAFARAAVVVGGTFQIPRQSASPLEGCGAVAAVDPVSDVLTLWVSNQSPHQYRTVLAGMLGIGENRLRLIVPDVGGGFGAKLHFYPEEVLACVLAMRLGRPVKWIEDRREHFLSLVHAREQRITAKAAFASDGRLLAVDAHIRGDVGAHLHTKGVSPIFVTGSMMPGSYRFEHYRARIDAVVTNKVPFGAYRAFGMQQSTFVIERLIDMGAAALAIDPLDLRRRNVIPPEAFPYRTAGGWLYDNGNYPEALRRAVEVAGYERLRQQQADARREGRLLGIGVCMYTEFTGMGPGRRMAAMGNRQGGYESAVVQMDATGRVTVSSGIIELGQGIRASLGQIAADVLGTTPEQVRVVLGDTDLCPYSSYGTADSRGSVVAGSAVLQASRALREKIVRLAAYFLEASPADIEFADERCYVRGAHARGLTLAQIAREAYRGQNLPPGDAPGLESRFIFEPENWTFPYGVHVAAVEIDPELGGVRFLGYWVVHDCGRVINPMLMDGQLQGAIAQGVGAALLEELNYDEAGQLLSGTFMDYLLPTACEVPTFALHHLETPSPGNPGGIKGMAEGGTIAAPAAVANAIADALAGLDAGLTGAVTSYPLSPPRIRQLAAGAGLPNGTWQIRRTTAAAGGRPNQ